MYLQVCQNVKIFEEFSWKELQVIIWQRTTKKQKMNHVKTCPCNSKLVFFHCYLQRNRQKIYSQVSQGFKPSEGVLWQGLDVIVLYKSDGHTEREDHSLYCVTHTRSIPNIKNTPPFCPQNSLDLSGHGLHKVSNAFHRDAGRCWRQCFPQLSSWLDVIWVVDHFWYTRETVERWKNSCVAVLDKAGVPGTFYRFKGIYILCFSLWMAHTHNSCLNCLKA